jgi:hypothetical protein
MKGVTRRPDPVRGWIADRLCGRHYAIDAAPAATRRCDDSTLELLND